MGFAPPEQLAMRPVYSSDIYALAATCVFLLTGKAPKDLCDPVTGELAWEQHTVVTPTFARVLNKMLELDVRKRYTSADEVIKALDLVPYEEELAGSMVNLKSTKDLTIKTKILVLRLLLIIWLMPSEKGEKNLKVSVILVCRILNLLPALFLRLNLSSN